MDTLDEMHRRKLLNADQRREIGEWVARAKTPEAIMAMPPPLWRALAMASLLMNIDADLLQPPPFGNE